MEIELIEIREFLARTPPFNTLPLETLSRLTTSIQVRYLRRDTPFPPEDASARFLYVVRSGAIELRDEEGQLTEKLSEGGLHSAACQLVEFDSDTKGAVVEDSLLYLLPCDTLKQLCHEFEGCARFFSDGLRQRIELALRSSREERDGSLNSLTLPVRQILRREPVCVEQSVHIRDAAALMAKHEISSVLVTHEGQLVGVVTDRDLRNRCLAVGLSSEEPVEAIMTREVHGIAAEGMVIDALNRMTSLRISHLPVLDQGKLVGVVSIGALARHQSANAAFLTVDIHKAGSVERLAEISARLPELQLQLSDARQIGEAISAITDSLTQRLLELAEDELGPPPVAYAWLAGGSQARREQSSHSDQDNALLLSDDLLPEHGDYFEQLAHYVCDGLAACGFPLCPGDSMASNPRWRQPLRVWRQYFSTWIETPEPMALMLASIFFDLRVVAGDASLFDLLHEEITYKSRNNAIFIAYMASNALSHRPPLGFFRTFVLIHDGEHDDTFDIKHRGIVPITDIARVLALSAGVAAVNTVERLRAARNAGVVGRDMGENLENALEYIAALRIRHQTAQIRRGLPADNYLPPARLSELEREHLKDAFRIIKNMQDRFETRYQTGRLG